MDEGSPAWPPRQQGPPEVLDRAHWETLRGPKDDPLVSKFMTLFARHEPPRVARLPKLASARDGPALARDAHTLAGSCAMLGAREMQAAALALERAAQGECWEQVPGRLAEVNQAWGRLRAVLATEGFTFT